jgi:hypothetical protein
MADAIIPMVDATHIEGVSEKVNEKVNKEINGILQLVTMCHRFNY